MKQSISQLAQLWNSLVDVAVEAVGEEATWVGSGSQVDNDQHLLWGPGVGDGVGVSWGEDEFTSVGVKDSTVVNCGCAVQGVTGS